MKTAALITTVIAAGFISILDADTQLPTFRAQIRQPYALMCSYRGSTHRPRSAGGDFEITDNGVVQQVDLISLEQLPLNVILAFDMSNSIVGERLGHLRLGAQAVLDGLGGEDRAALLTLATACSDPIRYARRARRARGTGRTCAQGLTA